MTVPGLRTVVTGRWRENCYLLRGPDGEGVVIDPGNDAETIIAAIESLAMRPSGILGTHGHHDHVGAVAAIQERYDAPFYLHPADEPLLRQVNAYRMAFEQAAPVPIPAIQHPLAGGTTLALGGLVIAVRHTPGHTPGGVAFQVANRLFVGDALLCGKVGRTDLPGGDGDDLRRTLCGLAELDPATELWPGHGHSTSLSAELASNEEFRRLIA